MHCVSHYRGRNDQPAVRSADRSPRWRCWWTTSADWSTITAAGPDEWTVSSELSLELAPDALAQIAAAPDDGGRHRATVWAQGSRCARACANRPPRLRDCDRHSALVLHQAPGHLAQMARRTDRTAALPVRSPSGWRFGRRERRRGEGARTGSDPVTRTTTSASCTVECRRWRWSWSARPPSTPTAKIERCTASLRVQLPAAVLYRS